MMQEDTSDIPIEQEFNWSKYQKNEIDAQIRKHGSKELAIVNMAATISSLEMDIAMCHDIIEDVENWAKYNHDMDIEDILNEERWKLNED